MAYDAMRLTVLLGGDDETKFKSSLTKKQEEKLKKLLNEGWGNDI